MDIALYLIEMGMAGRDVRKICGAIVSAMERQAFE
jgi:hypothetical protein